jgi:hypothetical protein
MSAPTADKLREIADWLDTLDKVAELWMTGVPVSPNTDIDKLNAARLAVRDKEVQNDLRAWAQTMEDKTK